MLNSIRAGGRELRAGSTWVFNPWRGVEQGLRRVGSGLTGGALVGFEQTAGIETAASGQQDCARDSVEVFFAGSKREVPRGLG